MPNIVPLFSLRQTLTKIDPDIVHIHWYMMDTISFEQIASLKYPVIMTMHDMFDVSIENPCPGSDYRFISGLTPANSNWVERWLFTRKKKAMHLKRPIMTGPSQWVCKTAASSIIGKPLQFHTIGNIYDPVFTFHAQLQHEARKFRILFGAYGGRKDPNKGWDDLARTLAFIPTEIKDNLEIVIFGEEHTPYRENDIQVKFAGIIKQVDQLQHLYNSADIVAVPSRIDNAPNVKFEAWLCGTPVIAFNRTGCAEHIIQKENGWTAQDGNFSEFAEGIVYFYRLFKEGLLSKTKEHIAQWAQKQFNEHVVLDAMQAVYSEAANISKK